MEVFFTLSGFLITQLLIAELSRRGRVDPWAFARARARRLLPGLVACVLGTVVAYRVLLPEEAPDLRADALASLGYLQNWHLVLVGLPYSEAFARPSPMLHIWSLAVEGQLYLLWSLLLVGVLATQRRPVVVAATATLAVGSAVMMAMRYTPDGGGLGYYATDARAAGFLVGAALALAWRPDAWSRRLRRAARVVLDLVAGVALLTLLVGFITVSEFDDALYERAGFLRVGLCTGAVIAAATRSDGMIAGLLGRPGLVAVGRRSYGLYLYHWPVFVAARDLPGPEWLRLGGSLAISIVVTELSYRFMELPIRRGGIRALAGQLGLDRATVAAATTVAAVATAGFVLMGTAAPILVTGTAVASSSGSGPLLIDRSASTSTTLPELAPDPVPPPPTTSGPVLVVGDSITLGSADAIRAALGPATTIDARVGRQFAAAPDIVAAWAARQHGSIVVVLGANGTVQRDDVEALVTTAGPQRIVLVGVDVPRRWQEPNNAALRDAAARHAPRVVFVDWLDLVAKNPGSLGPDGVHPGPQGRSLLARAVADAVRGF